MRMSLILVAAVCVGVAAQQAHSLVRDYFLQLPTAYFEVEGGDKAAYLKRYLQEENANLGYLKAAGEGAQGGIEILVFRRRQGSPVLAVHTFGEMSDRTIFLDRLQGQWTDASAPLVPQYEPSKRYYRLAPYGAGVEVHELVIKDEIPRPGRRLYRLFWNGERFEPRR